MKRSDVGKSSVRAKKKKRFNKARFTLAGPSFEPVPPYATRDNFLCKLGMSLIFGAPWWSAVILNTFRRERQRRTRAQNLFSN